MRLKGNAQKCPREIWYHKKKKQGEKKMLDFILFTLVILIMVLVVLPLIIGFFPLLLLAIPIYLIYKLVKASKNRKSD